MRGFARSLALGAVVGLALGAVLAVVAGGYLLVSNSNTVSDPTKIVVVFAIAREDGSPVAHTVAVVRPGAGGPAFYTVDTSATVGIPGVSESNLSEAYAYGGAAGVAKANDGGVVRRGTAWVDVPPAVWEGLVAKGVEVTLTEGFDVFDGERFMEFPAGPQTVPATDLRGLANGLAYLPLAERTAVREALATASMKALLAGATVPKGVTTNLSPAAWKVLAEAR